MANYGGTDPGRTGPYWRRQQHTTLPGERTGSELAAINALRAKMGLPPLGGPAQHTGRVAMPFDPGPPRPFDPGTGFPGGRPIGPPPEGYPRGAAPSGSPGHEALGQHPPAYGIPEGPPPGVQPGGLGQLQLPQLLALKAMLAKAQGQQARPALPAQRSVLPQLHQAVPVKAHVRIVPPRPALGAGNLPSHLRGAYPA